jgi:hypothetical protein
MRNVYKILVTHPEGMRQLGRLKCTCDDFGTDVKRIGWEEVIWINVAEDRDQW